MSEALAHIDLTQIDFSDQQHLKLLLLALMNHIEALTQRVEALEQEKQRLNDENQRLKGEKPKPRFKANITSAPKPEQQRGKPGPDRRIEIDQIQTVEVEDVPEDARFLGYRDIVVQELLFQRHNVCYRLKRYYSASTDQFYEAEAPEPGAGPPLRAFVLMAYFAWRIPQQKIVDLLQARGLSISAGTVSAMLAQETQARFTSDYTAIVKAGLSTSRYQHIDHTGLRQQGLSHQVAVLCTKAYAAFFVNRYRNRDTVRDWVEETVGGPLDGHVEVLVSDNAGAFLAQPMLHQVCWVHELRHYKTLKGAYFRSFEQEKAAFLERLYGYYAQLRTWRAAPSRAEAVRLSAAFDALFSGAGIAFEALRDRIRLTHSRQEALLLFLSDGRIPMENNEAERSLREVVLKRKISYGTRSRSGSQAWSVMLTLVETARKQSVDLYAYLCDRLSGEPTMPSLAACILAQAATPQAATR